MVTSVFTPRPLRPYMWALYAYARTVDDLGDEASGNRLERLDRFEAAFRACLQGHRRSALFVALGDTMERCRLPADPFLSLLDANRRDQNPTPFATFSEIEDYCRGSANSVGRLVLRIFGYDDPALDELADATTTALQLVNFYQDLQRDVQNQRLYLPLDELSRFRVTREEVLASVMSDNLAALLRASYERVWALFAKGRPLEGRVSAPLARQLALYRLGGSAVLTALEARLAVRSLSRPVLSSGAKLGILLRALATRPGGAA